MQNNWFLCDHVNFGRAMFVISIRRALVSLFDVIQKITASLLCRFAMRHDILIFNKSLAAGKANNFPFFNQYMTLIATEYWLDNRIGVKCVHTVCIYNKANSHATATDSFSVLNLSKELKNTLSSTLLHTFNKRTALASAHRFNKDNAYC